MLIILQGDVRDLKGCKTQMYRLVVRHTNDLERKAVRLRSAELQVRMDRLHTFINGTCYLER